MECFEQKPNWCLNISFLSNTSFAYARNFSRFFTFSTVNTDVVQKLSVSVLLQLYFLCESEFLVLLVGNLRSKLELAFQEVFH